MHSVPLLLYFSLPYWAGRAPQLWHLSDHFFPECMELTSELLFHGKGQKGAVMEWSFCTAVMSLSYQSLKVKLTILQQVHTT